MASRRGSAGILEITSEASLNVLDGSSQRPFKRRKLDPEVPHVTSLSASSSSTLIYIRNNNASASATSTFSLEPITFVPRSRISFAWFDTTPESSALPPGGLFTANIRMLERNLGNGHESTVLAARLLPDGGLYVIERVKRGIYALCSLASWVGEGELRVASKGWRKCLDTASKHEANASCKETRDWRELAGLDSSLFEHDSLFTERIEKLSASFAFGPSIIPDLHASTCEDVSMLDQNAPHSLPEIILPASRDELEQHPDAPETAQTAEEILDGLREQYLEALYVSKTSVAYFAKGPLTRCRAALQSSNYDNVLPPSELFEFYRSAILPVKKMDMKYKETLPSMIRDSTLIMSEEDEGNRKRKRKSSSKKKKKRIGKNGLYPDEENHIRKWWKSRHVSDAAISLDLKVEDEIKKYIGDLRLRETQLQILLILETIILESSHARPSEGDVVESAPAEASSKTSKKKKQQDLNFLLELLLDRLCIWHTVRSEDALIPDTVKESNDSHLSGKKVDNDVLRDFCSEVIIPFYAARLPEQCKAIKRKLGGPNFASPSRPPTSSQPRPQPNRITKRQQPAPQKTRRTLQRVLTDEKVANTLKARHPSLSRSITAPSIPDGRRDSVEPGLPSLSANVRGGLQVARRVDNREVDLNAAAKQHEAKLKKMTMLMEQKKELDAAINALRKPNRELVAKEIADTAEKRVSTHSSRKPKNPVRNPFGQGVQVMATPRGLRKKDVSIDLPPPPRSLARQSTGQNLDTSPNLGSDISVVPASAIRSKSSGRPSALNLGSDIGRDELHSVHETPSRGLSKLSTPPSSMAPNTPQDSSCSRVLFRKPTLPISRAHSDSSAVLRSCPSEKDLHVHDNYETTTTTTPRRTSLLAVEDTPPRSSSIIVSIPPPPSRTEQFTSAPIMKYATPVKGKGKMNLLPTEGTTPPEKSIYDELGWDDDELA